MKGAYCLILHLPKISQIKIGGLGLIKFKKGYYAYIGSAMSSLESRIRRHLSRRKRVFWHIDFLLRKAEIKEILVFESDRKIECEISERLSKKFESIKNFGSSDCRCKSHLFYCFAFSMNFFTFA